MDILNILLYALPGLIFIVLVHELGHLLLARASGIGVQVFSIFFGRAIYKFHWKGIEWRIGWIPFGGYCKMKGHDDLGDIKENKDPDEFYSRPAWARLLAIAGGPLFNLLFAFIIFFIITSMGEYKFPNLSIVVPIEKKIMNSPFKDGDRIIQINGDNVDSWNTLNALIGKASLNETAHKIKVEREGEIIHIDYKLDLSDLIKKEAADFQLPKLVRVFAVPETVSIQKAGKSEKEVFLNPSNGILEKGAFIFAIDDRMIRLANDLTWYLNQSEKKDYERKIQFFKLPAGAEILKIENRSFHILTEIESLLLDENKKNYKIEYQLENGLKEEGIFLKHEAYVKPVVSEFYNKKTKQNEKRYLLGIHLQEQNSPLFNVKKEYVYYSIPVILSNSLSKLWMNMKLSIYQFKFLFSLPFETIRQGVAGPIGVVEILGNVASRDWLLYINLIATLSVILGIINLLPIPALDGGHLLLTFIELVLRRPLSIKLIQIIQWIGVFIIISLAILITFNDIIKIINR